MGRESETKLEQLTLDDYNPITGKRMDPQTDIRRPSNVSKSMPQFSLDQATSVGSKVIEYNDLD